MNSNECSVGILQPDFTRFRSAFGWYHPYGQRPKWLFLHLSRKLLASIDAVNLSCPLISASSRFTLVLEWCFIPLMLWVLLRGTFAWWLFPDPCSPIISDKGDSQGADKESWILLSLSSLNMKLVLCISKSSVFSTSDMSLARALWCLLARGFSLWQPVASALGILGMHLGMGLVRWVEVVTQAGLGDLGVRWSSFLEDDFLRPFLSAEPKENALSREDSSSWMAESGRRSIWKSSKDLRETRGFGLGATFLSFDRSGSDRCVTVKQPSRSESLCLGALPKSSLSAFFRGRSWPFLGLRMCGES